MNDEAPTRPGWYPSSNRPGVYRLWDGSAWIAWRHPEATATPAEALPPARIADGSLTIGSTREDRTRARAQQHRDGVRAMELRAEDGEAHLRDVPTVRGRMLFWWTPEIEQLVRDHRLGEALELAWECMEAAERMTPPPYGWANRAAIIARKAGRNDLEVEILRRFLSVSGDVSETHPIAVRLPKAEALAAKRRPRSGE